VSIAEDAKAVSPKTNLEEGFRHFWGFTTAHLVCILKLICLEIHLALYSRRGERQFANPFVSFIWPLQPSPDEPSKLIKIDTSPLGFWILSARDGEVSSPYPIALLRPLGWRGSLRIGGHETSCGIKLNPFPRDAYGSPRPDWGEGLGVRAITRIVQEVYGGRLANSAITQSEVSP
jgi:hypothetical protein